MYEDPFEELNKLYFILFCFCSCCFSGLYKQGNNLFWSDEEPAGRYLFFSSDKAYQGSDNCFQLSGNKSYWITEDCDSKEYFVCEKGKLN